MTTFENGFNAFASVAGVNMAAFGSGEYVGNVEIAIDELQKAINGLSKDGRGFKQLKGIAAEYWHTQTLNIDAAVKSAPDRAEVLESHVVGSVDIQGNWEDASYGLKYYGDGMASAREQAEINRAKYEDFYKSQVKKGLDPPSYESYFRTEYDKYLSECERNHRTPQSIDEVFPGYKDRDNPLYMGQYRLVPANQLENAREWLKQKILKESNGGRPEQVKRYQETLAKLTDRIKSNEGSESIPLSKEDAEKLAQLAKEEGFEPSDWGLTTEELIGWDNIMRQANEAGLSAAVISVVLEVAPALLKIILKLIDSGEINASDFKRVGFAAVKGSTLGYVRGGIAAAITIACKSGRLGTTLKSTEPTLIGAIVALTMNTIQNATLMAFGRMSQHEFANRCIQDLCTTTCSLAAGIAVKKLVSKYMGTALQSLVPQLPVLGYMLGSFIGGVVGALVYPAAYSCVMSYCINSGCTFFGLVTQDYTLPKEVLEKLGLASFEYEEFQYMPFEYEKFEYEEFQYEKFEYAPIDICFIRRGVIGVNTIGFVT